MNLQRIMQAEHMGQRAIRSVRPFIERAEDREAANAAELILAEARFFAVAWNVVRAQEDSEAIGAEEARKQRQELIQRLTTVCAPDRI